MRTVLVGLLLLQGCSSATASSTGVAGRAVAASRGGSPEEAGFVAYARAHATEATALLERLVNINSGTMNFDGVREAGRILRSELDGIGFSTRWIDLPETKRAGHLFAERKGTKGKRLLLIGHLDTVFEKDSPFQKFVREGNVVKGPGVADMKGGDIVMLFALKALAEVGALDGTTITAAFTGDEESPGQPLDVARRDLIDAAKRSDAALEFENGIREGNREYGTIARRSLGWWVLHTTGQVGHAQGIFSDAAGHGAVYEAARILWAFVARSAESGESRSRLPDDGADRSIQAGGRGRFLRGAVHRRAGGPRHLRHGRAFSGGDSGARYDLRADRARGRVDVPANLAGT
jgi:glutamate carboxypeptidase